jgi:hypothetical protein
LAQVVACNAVTDSGRPEWMDGRAGELSCPFIVCRAVLPLERGGLCGCERTGQDLPWHDKARFGPGVLVSCHIKRLDTGGMNSF